MLKLFCKKSLMTRLQMLGVCSPALHEFSQYYEQGCSVASKKIRGANSTEFEKISKKLPLSTGHASNVDLEDLNNA